MIVALRERAPCQNRLRPCQTPARAFAFQSGGKGASRPPRPLRTERETFASLGSSRLASCHTLLLVFVVVTGLMEPL
jgi:hypothetical protein